MAFHRGELSVATKGRGTVDITANVAQIVSAAGMTDGLATVFVHHTSASVIISENADPTVRSDLERYIAKLVPDGDPAYEHDAEGPDDMSAHIRSVLTATSISIPIERGKLALGTWQGIYLWEHRAMAHARRVTVTVVG